MQPAENKDYSRDVILRLSPTRNTIIVEEQKPGGIAAYREIDPLELYYVINQSYASNDYLDSGFLPEHCLHLSMSATEKGTMFEGTEGSMRRILTNFSAVEPERLGRVVKS